jgi:hypothetical protein
MFFSSRCSVTVPNNEDSSALLLTSLPAGYNLTTYSFRVKVIVILALAVYLQSIRLGAEPVEDHGHRVLFCN